LLADFAAFLLTQASGNPRRLHRQTFKRIDRSWLSCCRLADMGVTNGAWIGLVKPDTFHCANDDLECLRSNWTWLNGFTRYQYLMWHRWAPSEKTDLVEPGSDEFCTRLKPNGYWYGGTCNYAFQSMCEKGTVCCHKLEITAVFFLGSGII